MTDALHNSEILNRLADIELPAPPDWQPLLTASGTIIIALMLIVLVRLYILRRKKNSIYNNKNSDPALTARLKLQQLIKNWKSHTLTDREAAYQLTTLLRLGLGLPQITPLSPPHLAADQQAWQETVSLCTRLRYHPTSGMQLSLEVFQRAEQWLIKSSQSSQQPSQHNSQGI